MKSVEKYFLKLCNLLGLSCYRLRDGHLAVSETIVARNYFLVVLILGIKLFINEFIDLQAFMPDGTNLNQFTSFSISMFSLYTLAPILTSSFMIVNHQKKRKEILDFMASLEKFNHEFIDFTSSKTLSVIRSKFSITVFVYLIALRFIEGALSMEYKFWVIFAYTHRIFCEIIVVLFIFMFTVAIKYATTVLKNLNTKIEVAIDAGNFRTLEACSDFYERIFGLLANFYGIFGCQILCLSCYMTMKLTLQVILKEIHKNYLSGNHRRLETISYFTHSKLHAVTTSVNM